MRVGLPVVDMTTGLNAALGILLALNERHRSGRGQFVEAALFDSALSLLHPHAPNYFMTGDRPQPTGNAHPSIYPYDCFPTQGAPIYLAVGNDGQFAALCRHLECADLISDPRFKTNAQRSVHRNDLRALLEGILIDKDGVTIADELVRQGVPCSAVMAVDEALEHPQTRHRGMVVSIGKHYRGLGSPIRLHRTPASYRIAPPSFPAELETQSMGETT
ncbi:Succinyl-CoA:(R)-benzylsuccinate CoA-transferase subunit BbsF [compost metagenome]